MNPEWLGGLLLFAQSVLFGAALSVYYGLFRFLRALIPHPGWLIVIEDLAFWLPASVMHVFFHFAWGEGETRWFSILGIALGFLAYLLSVGKWVQKAGLALRESLAKRFFRPLRARWRTFSEKSKSVRAEKKARCAEKKKQKRAARLKIKAANQKAREAKRAAKQSAVTKEKK